MDILTATRIQSHCHAQPADGWMPAHKQIGTMEPGSETPHRGMFDLLLLCLQLVISEWGVGGGTQDGQGIAPDVEFVAGRPFFGLWYPYR
jgi:hypothetical protein